MSTAEPICCLMASKGTFAAPCNTMVSKRLNISLVELACPVEREPSCPVFMACSISKASRPRTSPTTIRSGLIRREDLIKSVMEISPTPAELAFLVSSRTRLSTFSICNSAVSSTVITRSSLGI